MRTKTHTTEVLFDLACDEVSIRPEDKRTIDALLAQLREKNEHTHKHYLHMLRVGLLCREIGRFLHHEEKPLLFAGALHDLGKVQSPTEVLGKTCGWHGGDAARMRPHVMDGYRILRGRLDFTAEIVVLHHRFQMNGYPKKLPFPLHEYDEANKLLIMEYGRILAIADYYDALHREDKGETLNADAIKERMFEGNTDRTKLIHALYEARILR
ncbi:MAG TPA: HD domain-containing protein [Candidatus Paceibacterota bacterium]|nr:HD domain-containing protein [Candidatus Paceibacterota bacterium]